MKIQPKSILQFAVIALAWGALCFSASIRAQSAPASPTPDANKKENPASGATTASPTPSPTPKG